MTNGVFAQDKEDESIEWLALSVYGLFDYPIYDTTQVFSKIISCGAGAGLGLEFGLPFELPRKNQLGLSVRSFWRHGFIKDTSIVANLEQLTVFGGVFYKLPLGTNDFELVPELSYGGLLHFVNKAEENGLNNIYFSHQIYFSPALRANVSGKSNFVMLEFAPVYTLTIENNAQMLHEVGLRLGAVLHLLK